MGHMFDKGLLAGLGLVLALLIIIPIVNLSNTSQLNDDARTVVHSREVLSLVADVLLALVDAETGQRGYISTGQEEFLQPYRESLEKFGERLARLKSETRDNPVQQENIARLEALSTERMNLLAEGILQRREGLLDSGGLITARRGKESMDSIRDVVDSMRREEARLLEGREAQSRLAYRKSVVTTFFGTIVSLGLFGVFTWLLRRNLLARHRTTALLHEQREWFETTLASIGDAVIATDAEGRVVFLNSVAEEATGWNEDEARGVPLDQVFHIVNEQTRESVDNPAIRALAQGRIIGLANHTLLIARDGTERPIDDSAAPIRNVDGRIVGAVLVFRDISESKHQENELRMRHEMLKMAEAAARIGHFEWDISAARSRWSPEIESLYGLPPGGFEGDHEGWRKLVHPDDVARVEEDVQRSLETGKLQTDFRTIWPDGTVRWLEARAVVSKYVDGKPVQMVGINMDITERKQAEVSLRDADRRKDEFMATLAHELRNPLAAMRSGLRVLDLEKDDLEIIEKTHAMIERQVGHVARLIDDLLDLSRIRQGRVELRLSRVDLGTVVGHALETCRPVVERRGHELTTSLPEGPIPIRADVDRLSQVLTNLLNNAAKFTERGGRISLSVEREGGEALIRVRDTGVGIPAHMLPRIFDMYTQVDSTRDRSQGGLGIGLKLVRGLVEMHGGVVESHSDGPGHGSEFVVRIPLCLD